MNRILSLSLIFLLAFGNCFASAFAKSTSKKALSVEQMVPSEEEIKLTQQVQTALSNYTNKVSVAVVGNMVNLSGEVDSEAEYEQVILLAQAVAGVSDVKVAKLSIKDNSLPLYDLYLIAKIKGVLIQTGLLKNDISQWPIHIQAKDSEIYLSGKIPESSLQHQLIEVVKSVHGVRKIHDELEISVSSSAPMHRP